MAIVQWWPNAKPYGRKFDTGGSSSGSASSIAANMLQQQWELKLRDPFSPSSSNSIVGLKPTTGLLSVPVLYPCLAH
jgi:amidase